MFNEGLVRTNSTSNCAIAKASSDSLFSYADQINSLAFRFESGLQALVSRISSEEQLQGCNGEAKQQVNLNEIMSSNIRTLSRAEALLSELELLIGKNN